MATCTAADIRLLGELAGDFLDPPFTDAILERIIASTQALIDDACWSGDEDAGLCLLSAHFAIKQKQGAAGGGVGVVTAEAGGGLSRSYAAVQTGKLDYDLATTSYGMQFIMLRDAQVCAYVPVVLKC